MARGGVCPTRVEEARAVRSGCQTRCHNIIDDKRNTEQRSITLKNTLITFRVELKMGASRVESDQALGFQQATSLAVDVSSFAPAPHHESDDYDACQYCENTCDGDDSCVSYQKTLGPQICWLIDALSGLYSNSESTYTMCQLRRHNHAGSAWILVGRTIYDVTPYIRSHPGGADTILRKSGGATDCTEDLQFHSKRAQKEWRKFKVGMLRDCSCRGRW